MRSRSTTQAGPVRNSSGRSPMNFPPDRKWAGASRWVLTCSVIVISWPPALSKASRLIQRVAGRAYPANAGVCSEKSWVRSINLRLEPAFSGRLSGELGSIHDSSLLQDAVDVECDRVLAQVHLFGDRGIGKPFHHQTQDLYLQPAELWWSDSRFGGSSWRAVLRSVECTGAIDGHRGLAGQHLQKVEPLPIRLQMFSAEYLDHSSQSALRAKRQRTAEPEALAGEERAARAFAGSERRGIRLPDEDPAGQCFVNREAVLRDGSRLEA